MALASANQHLPSQTTPASSLWAQLWDPIPRWRHSVSFDSLPVHVTSSNQMGPLPGPKRALRGADRTLPQPSCLHTTWASTRPQASSHTVPHCPRRKISTLPEQELFPPLARRTCPSTVVLLSTAVVWGMPVVSWAAEVWDSGSGVVGETVVFGPGLTVRKVYVNQQDNNNLHLHQHRWGQHSFFISSAMVVLFSPKSVCWCIC